MFAWWGRTVGTVRWWVVAAALALVAIGATWGSGVFGRLTGGGYDDPNSEANRAAAAISTELGQRDPDLVVLWSSDTATVDDPVFRSAVDALRDHPEVARLTSFFDTGSPAFVSNDRHATYAAINLRATGADGKMTAYRALQPSWQRPRSRPRSVAPSRSPSSRTPRRRRTSRRRRSSPCRY